MHKFKGVLFDVGYETHDKDAIIKVLAKNDEGIFEFYDKSFKPYLLVEDDTVEGSMEGNVARELDQLKTSAGNGIINIEKTKRILGAVERNFLKVNCRHPQDVVSLREFLRNIGRVFEDAIPLSRRYIIDKRLRPMAEIEMDVDKNEIIAIRDKSDVDKDTRHLFNILCFDIEVYNPYIAPREKKDPIIIISYYDLNRKKVGAITWKEAPGIDKDRIELIVVKDEKELLETFCRMIDEREIDVLIGYNSASFDLPYIAKRAKALGLELPIGRDGSQPFLKQTAMTTRVSIEGRAHFDVYYMIRLLAAAQALKTQRYTLEEVYAEMFGKQKLDLDEHDMCAIWDSDKRRKDFIEYSCSDAESTAEIFDKVSPLAFELSKLAQMPLHDVSGATSGQLVESLLMNAASQNNIIIPNKPRGEEVGMREEDQIQGAYVKLPSPGIYENIAVFDFRSLYPSILITYNVGPDTLNCGHEECKKGRNISPSGHYFCMKRPGLVPLTMKGLFERRKAAKAQLKTVSKEGQTALNARVAAMKIILNATIGMFRYVRARWYSRECAEAIVSGWARFYVQDVAQKAEKAGYEVLYGDTDSLFVLLGNKSEEEAIGFMDSINKDLPEAMELELEDFYSRGVFVAKKQEKGMKGAKKKYALINKEGKIKIRGFELVRRDWSKVARDAQRRVLEAILIGGSKEKAMEIVKSVVQRIKDGEVGKDELIIYTQLRKKNYEIMSPELAAADKAKKRGMKISTGAIIGYIITRSGKSISEKAELAQYANDYDPDYYINNQVIPAVLRILGELGYTEDDIKYIGKQSSLGGWI